MRQHYVLGFRIGQKVLLLKKLSPAWQGLNGVGGKIEKGESQYDAMIREYREEVGVDVHDWEYRMCLDGEDFVLFVFCSKGPIVAPKIVNDIGEELVIAHVSDIPHLNVIPNLRWMIPLCADAQIDGQINLHERKTT